jgi:biotin carboxyl carrier protein
MKYFVSVGGVQVEVAVEPDGIRVDGELVDAALEPLAGTPLQQLRMGERTLVFSIDPRERGEWELGYRGERWTASVVDERTRHIRSLTGEGRQRVGAGEVKAPMPGLVLRVLVEPGQRVEAGAGLAVLEAMKMENQIKAPVAGVVEAIRVEAGKAVEKGQVLVVLAAPPGDPPAGDGVP